MVENLISIKGGAEGVSRLFIDYLRHYVGDGICTLFWWDTWMEGGLKNRFSRIFDLPE